MEARPGMRESTTLGRLGLGVALGASLVVVLDFSIVNVALPALGVAMGVSTTTSEWVVTAYALTFGGLLVLGGRASDFFGRRRMLLVGLVVFGLASAAGGVAANFSLLAASRAVQGAAAALVAPAALSILTTSYPEGPARNRVLGYFGVTASVGFVVGLVAGGILVDTVGWRGVFFVNVPVCLALVMVGSKVLPAGTIVAGSRHLDLPGAVLVTSGTAALVYAPTLGTNDGWTSLAFVGCMLVSSALLGAFVFVERRSPQPLIPLRIFRHHLLVIGDAVSGLQGAWNAGEVLVLSLYCQQVLGYSPLVSGLVAVPQGIGGLLRGVFGARLIDRIGLKPFLAGNCLLVAVSTFALFRVPVTTHYPVLGIVLLAFGFGSTNVVFGSTVAASTGIVNNEQGLAGALVNATRQIGAAVGVAVLLSIVAIDAGAQASTAQLAAGYRLALACAAGVAAAAALLSLRIRGGRVTPNAPTVEVEDNPSLTAVTPAEELVGAVSTSRRRTERQSFAHRHDWEHNQRAISH
jgi:EmrB/QacA subfamily drug resistance transporter